MKKFKWVSFILVICILASSLVACAGGNDQKETGSATVTPSKEDTTDETPVASGKVTFWNDKLATVAETAKKLSDAWTTSSGLVIDVNSYGDTASYQTAMSQSIDNASAAPNAFTWWSGEQLETLATSGKLLELDDVWDKIIEMGVSPDIKDALSYNGHAYAVPYSLLNNVCIYNKDAFAKAGITDTPKTFDEFLADCQKLVDAGITPIGLKNDSWASFIWFQALVASYDPNLYIGVCNGSIKYNDAKMLEVFKIWQDMFDKGYFADPVAASDNGKRIALGECAIYIEPQGEITQLENGYGLIPGENIDVFALPSMSGGKSVVFFEVAPMAVPAVVSDPEASKKLLEGYYSDATQNVTLKEEGIVLTSTVKIEDPTLAKVSAMAADTNNYQSILRYYENTPSALRDYALDELSKFMAGQQDVTTTLGNIQVKADETFTK
jgi:multiple sugar transport system substrate-binding protein